MLINRVIVQLLIKNRKLIKTRRFGKHDYVGDPLNAIKIFNEKAVDELTITDMSASNNGIDYDLIGKMAAEAFMPVCYSGGIKNKADAQRLFNLGVEKICLTSAAITDKGFLRELVEIFGSQSIVVNVNVRKNIFGTLKVFDANKRKTISLSPLDHINAIGNLKIGELVITDVNRDGELCGLNLDLLKLAKNADMPVVICGGMNTAHELIEASQNGASAVMGASCFVFNGPHRAVLINYPVGGGYSIMKEAVDD